MELVNQTIAAANLYVSPISEEWRSGVLIAKLTFSVSRDGGLSAVSDDPAPILDVDEETELGALPRDLIARREPGLDVVVLGAACAPLGRPVQELRVVLRVGDVTRHLDVCGDRRWLGTGETARVSEPVPFVRMPLTWDRAFGGQSDVWLDPQTVVPVGHPGNPRGRGYDVEGIVGGWRRSAYAADGFPRLDYVRALPNLEHPLARVRSWSDEPEPYCWSGLPPSVATYLTARRARDAGARGNSASAPIATAGHPDWRIAAPAPGDPVVLEGCRPEGPWWFRWPSLRVSHDYEIGPKRGSRPLEPILLVLLPDQSRFTITFRDWFKFPHDAPDDARSIRLRLE